MISVTPPAQRVQFILGEEEDDGTHGNVLTTNFNYSSFDV